jgi:hypothetical protein
VSCDRHLQIDGAERKHRTATRWQADTAGAEKEEIRIQEPHLMMAECGERG